MKSLKHTKFFLVTLVLLITGVVLALTTSTVMAGPKWEQRCSTLKPESGNEVKAPEFEVILGKDSVTVRGSSYISPGGIFNGVEWAIDLENCSYQTKRIAISNKPADDNTVNDERWYEKTVSEGEQAVTSPTGNYLVGIKIVTKDPPGYWLAATTHKLYWTTYSNGTVQWYHFVKGCTGYTTPLNTHWYVSSCQWLNENPYYSSDRRYVYSRIRGSYYNYDFLDPNQRTDAIHYSKITGRNDGSWVHEWSATHSGEFYWLLRGEVVPDYP